MSMRTLLTGLILLTLGCTEIYSPQEQAWLNEHGRTIRIAVGFNAPPLSFIDQDGRYRGLEADYLKLIAQLQGLELEHVPVKTWSQAIKLLESGEIDLLSMQSSPSRLQKFAFSEVYVQTPYVIITRRNSDFSLNSDGASIGVPRDYLFNDYLAQTHPKVEIITVDDDLNALQSVSSGLLKACAVNQPYATRLIEQHNLDNLSIAGMSGFVNKLSFATRRDQAALRDIIDRGLKRMPPQQHDELQSRWLGLQNNRQQPSLAAPVILASILSFAVIILLVRGLNPRQLPARRALNFFSAILVIGLLSAATMLLWRPQSVRLTPAEQAWLAANQGRIRAAKCQEVPPIAFTDRDGGYVGMAVDIVRLLEERIGFKTELICIETWAETYQKLSSGELTYTVMQNTPQRAEIFSFTEPILNIPNVLVTRSINQQEIRIADLAKISVTADSQLANYLAGKYPQIQLEPVATYREGLQNVALGQSDVFAGNLAYIVALIEKQGISNLRIAAELDYDHTTALATLKENEIFRDILQKGLNTIPASRMEQIQNRWLRIQKPPIEPANLYLLILILLVIIALIITVTAWNKILRSQVHKKTAALIESQKRFRDLVENSSDLIWEIDQNGNYIYVNPQFQTLLGYAPDKMLKHSIYDFLDQDYAQQITPLYQELISRQQPFKHLTVKFRKANDQLLITESSGVPFMDSQGVFQGFRGVTRDVTERRRAEEALLISEENLAKAQELTHLGSWEWDIERDSIFWSEEMFRIYGINPDTQDLIGAVRSMIHPEDLQQYDQAMQAGGHAPDSIEYRIIRPDGSKRTVQAKAEFSYNSGGQLARMVGTVQDITERKKAETELHRLRNYLSNIINSMPSVLVGVDVQTCITQWNQEAARQTGIPADEALGRRLEDVFPYMADQIDKISESIRSREVRMETKLGRQADGNLRYEDITIFPLIANGVQGAVIRIDDTTERIMFEEMMIQSEKMMSVGGLAAGMAHEINNPLAGILQNVQVILNRIRPDLQKNKEIAAECNVALEDVHCYLEKRDLISMLANIAQTGQRAAQVVDNMLSFSRKSSGSAEPEDLAALLERTVELAANDYDLKKSYDFRHIEIIRDYDSDLPRVTCQASKIQQVILNLLKNGAQAMAEERTEKSPQPRFVLRLRREGSMAHIEVEDNGPGMSEEVRRRIFEPFFTTKQKNVGTGLGLSVSYFIITEDHKGSMLVESAPGQGARFIIRLPINGRLS